MNLKLIKCIKLIYIELNHYPRNTSTKILDDIFLEFVNNNYIKFETFVNNINRLSEHWNKRNFHEEFIFFLDKSHLINKILFYDDFLKEKFPKNRYLFYVFDLIDLTNKDNKNFLSFLTLYTYILFFEFIEKEAYNFFNESLIYELNSFINNVFKRWIKKYDEKNSNKKSNFWNNKNKYKFIINEFHPMILIIVKNIIWKNKYFIDLKYIDGQKIEGHNNCDGPDFLLHFKININDSYIYIKPIELSSLDVNYLTNDICDQEWIDTFEKKFKNKEKYKINVQKILKKDNKHNYIELEPSVYFFPNFTFMNKNELIQRLKKIAKKIKNLSLRKEIEFPIINNNIDIEKKNDYFWFNFFDIKKYNKFIVVSMHHKVNIYSKTTICNKLK